MSRWLGASRPRAIAIGQHIAALTGGPSLGVGALIDRALSSADDLLDAARTRERRRVEEYRRLLELVAGRSEGLEAFARAQIAADERAFVELADDDDDDALRTRETTPDYMRLLARRRTRDHVLM